MNDAFKHIPYDSPHVHWHVRPRYSKIIKILDAEFVDSEFGKHYKTRWDGREDFVVADIVMQRIQNSIKF